MKHLVWKVFALFGMVWSGCAWLLARLGAWATEQLARVDKVDWVAKACGFLNANPAFLCLGSSFFGRPNGQGSLLFIHGSYKSALMFSIGMGYSENGNE